MASLVLVMMFLCAMAAIQQGFTMLDTARNTTLAGQIIQSEIEDLRLKSWGVLADASKTPSGTLDLSQSIGKNLGTAESQALTKRFTATRQIVGEPGRETDFKRVTITVTWNDYLGRPHSRSYETLLGHFGLSDYFVATHTTAP